MPGWTCKPVRWPLACMAAMAWNLGARRLPSFARRTPSVAHASAGGTPTLLAPYSSRHLLLTVAWQNGGWISAPCGSIQGVDGGGVTSRSSLARLCTEGGGTPSHQQQNRNSPHDLEAGRGSVSSAPSFKDGFSKGARNCKPLALTLRAATTKSSAPPAVMPRSPANGCELGTR